MENGLTKADLTAALSAMKTEIVGEVSAAMRIINDDLKEKMRQIETNLLTEFHRYGKGQQLRMHTIENHDAVVIEDLLHLESRRPPTV